MSSSAARPSAPMPDRRGSSLRQRWPVLAFAASCLVVLLANGALVVLAVATWPGLQTEDAYQKGLAYNAALAAARDQAALGWRAELTFTPTAERRGRLEVRLEDAAGQPVERAEVRVDLVRPTQAGHDFSTFLDRAAGGVYAGETAFPLAGIWDVRLRAERGQKLYQATSRVFVR